MAVGIILEAQQAETVLQSGQADLIAIGRQVQFNPTSPITRRMTSASTAVPRSGRRNSAGGWRSGSERWKVSPRRLAWLRGAREASKALAFYPKAESFFIRLWIASTCDLSIRYLFSMRYSRSMEDACMR